MAEARQRVSELLQTIRNRLQDTASGKERPTAPLSQVRLAADTRWHDETTLTACLAELCSQLNRQFTLEEDGDWLDDLLATSPQCLPAVRRLQHEHVALLEQLEVVQDVASAVGDRARTLPGVAVDFERFTERLATHESREDQLLQLIVSDEVGVLD